ncbi:caspase family protein [Nonomuraea fuscirosea]
MNNREALLIATGRYDDGRFKELRAPAQDVDLLDKVLADPGIGDFRVSSIVDQPAHLIQQEIERFFIRRRPDDLLLLHFSCHGIKDDNGRLYFAAKNTNRDFLGSTTVSSVFLNECMSASRARSIVLLLDCCYSGAFLTGSKADHDVHLKDKLSGRGRAVLTATNSVEYAWEGGSLKDILAAPSVFTSAIIQGLKTGEADLDQDGRISIDDLYNYVYAEVQADQRRQTPQKWVLLQDAVYIANAGRNGDSASRTRGKSSSHREATEEDIRRAAEHGNADAALRLAKILDDRKLTVEAKEWRIRAADAGNAEAAFILAGTPGLSKSEREKWLQQAAGAGHRDAALQLGSFYKAMLPGDWEERATKADPACAEILSSVLHWYEVAAKDGDADAAYHAAEIHMAQIHGNAKKHYPLVHHWLQQATYLGHTQAARQWLNLLSGEEPKGTNEEWERAEEALAIWRDYRAGVSDKALLDEVALEVAKLVPPGWPSVSDIGIRADIEQIMDLAIDRCEKHELQLELSRLLCKRIPENAGLTNQYDDDFERASTILRSAGKSGNDDAARELGELICLYIPANWRRHEAFSSARREYFLDLLLEASRCWNQGIVRSFLPDSFPRQGELAAEKVRIFYRALVPTSVISFTILMIATDLSLFGAAIWSVIISLVLAAVRAKDAGRTP